MNFINNNDLDSFVLSNIKTNNKKGNNEKSKKKKKTTKYNEEYTFDTVEFYKSIRKLKLDAIMNTETDETRFLYYNMWEPLTGEILDKDPYGPLCFDPVYLIYHYYNQRLNNLWVKESDEQGGYYSGYYDSGVGAGEDCLIMSRGYHPEKYLFRLPIVDCYLTENHNYQFITMGPKLTFEQIAEINRKVDKQKFIKLFQKVIKFDKYYIDMIPDLTLMKTCYDLAIKENIKDISDIKEILMKIMFIVQKYNKIYRYSIPSMVSNKSLFQIIRDSFFFLVKIDSKSKKENNLKNPLDKDLFIDSELISLINDNWIFANKYPENYINIISSITKNKPTKNITENELTNVIWYGFKNKNENLIENFYINVIKLSKSVPCKDKEELEKQFLNIINRRAVDILVSM